MGSSTSSVFEAFGSGVKSSFSSVKLPTMNNMKRFSSVLGTTSSSILSTGKEIITSKPAQNVAAAVGTDIIHKEIRSSVSSRPSFLNRITKKFRSNPKKPNNNGNIEMSNMSYSTKINESQQLAQQPQSEQQQQNAGNKQTSKKETTPSKKEKTPAKKEKTPVKKEKKTSKKENTPSKKEKKSSKK
jgi:hypothetical protein